MADQSSAEVELFPYQRDAIDKIRLAFGSGRKKVLFQLPTGGGKTFTFAFVVKSALERRPDQSILILAHRNELLYQIQESLARIGVDSGYIAAGLPENLNAKVQIGSVMTVVRRLEKIPAPKFIIIDECHHASAETYVKILSRFDGVPVLGVTATPCRIDDKPLGKVFDHMVTGPSVSELIALGRLTRTRVFAAPVKINMDGAKKVAGDYSKKDLEARSNTAEINGCVVTTYQKHATGKLCLAFCASVKHATELATKFVDAGIPAGSIYGDMPREERTAIMAAFREKKILVLTSVGVIGEGVDVPAVEAISLVRPTQSLSLYIQQVGRGLRAYPGKEVALVLDHTDNTREHGFVEDEITWSLEEGAQKEKNKKDPEERIHQCEECFHIFDPTGLTECPECDHPIKRERKEKKINDVDLIELQRENLNKRRLLNGTMRPRNVQDLWFIRDQKGHHWMWIQHECRRLGFHYEKRRP